jgi:hypothetical protein
MTITLVFEKNTNFYVENCRKSQKIVIITSTPACRLFSVCQGSVTLIDIVAVITAQNIINEFLHRLASVEFEICSFHSIFWSQKEAGK